MSAVNSIFPMHNNSSYRQPATFRTPAKKIRCSADGRFSGLLQAEIDKIGAVNNTPDKGEVYLPVDCALAIARAIIKESEI